MCARDSSSSCNHHKQVGRQQLPCGRGGCPRGAGRGGLVGGYLELHVEVGLSQGEYPHGCLGLAQVIVDADQGLHRRLRAALVLVLLVVKGLGKGMALLRQGTQSPESNNEEILHCQLSCLKILYMTGTSYRSSANVCMSLRRM